MKAPDDNE